MSDYVDKFVVKPILLIVGMAYFIGMFATALAFFTAIVTSFEVFGITSGEVLKYSGYTSLSCIGIYILYCTLTGEDWR